MPPPPPPSSCRPLSATAQLPDGTAALALVVGPPCSSSGALAEALVPSAGRALYLYALGADGAAGVAMAAQYPAAHFEGRITDVAKVRLAAGAEWLAASCADGSAVCFDRRSASPAAVIRTAGAEAWSVCGAPTDALPWHVAVGRSDGNVGLFDARKADGGALATLRAFHAEGVTSLAAHAVNGDHAMLFSGAQDGLVCMFDVARATPDGFAAAKTVAQTPKRLKARASPQASYDDDDCDDDDDDDDDDDEDDELLAGVVPVGSAVEHVWALGGSPGRLAVQTSDEGVYVYGIDADLRGATEARGSADARRIRPPPAGAPPAPRETDRAPGDGGWRQVSGVDAAYVVGVLDDDLVALGTPCGKVGLWGTSVLGSGCEDDALAVLADVHTDVVRGIGGCGRGHVVTAGEDGCVALWDGGGALFAAVAGGGGGGGGGGDGGDGGGAEKKRRKGKRRR